METHSANIASEGLSLVQLTELVDHLSVGILVVNQSGKITWHNNYVARKCGQQAEKNISELLPSFPLSLLEDGAKLFPAQYTDYFKNKSIFIQCTVVRDAQKNLVITMHEVDVEQKQLQEMELKKNAAEILLKSAILGTGMLNEALTEVCRIASSAMEVTRVNIWEFGAGQTSITSIVNYDARHPQLLPNATLYRYQIPKYFSLFESEEIIPTKDALNDPNTDELKNGYLDVHGIHSLMDVPVRIAGKMIGVVCFEDTHGIREWNNSEQKFGLFISQVIALAIESSRRKQVQTDLEHALDEKRILFNEIHHRVRNNFSLIQDLVRAEAVRAQDNFHRELFRELRDRISSLDMLQRQLYRSAKVDRVNFRDLILDLVAGYRATFAGRATDFITTLDQCELNVSQASICGLFVNEIMMFLLSETDRTKSKESIIIRLKKINTRIQISIDSSMEFQGTTEKERMLTSFELAEKLGGKLEINRSKGTIYRIEFESNAN